MKIFNYIIYNDIYICYICFHNLLVCNNLHIFNIFLSIIRLIEYTYINNTLY